MANGPTFISLPNELLEDIFRRAQTPSSSLFALANTCARLQFSCLSLYLQDFGQIDPEESCTVIMEGEPRDDDVLAALSLSTFITKTKHFSCRFQGSSLHILLHNFSRVERLLHRFSSVGAVTLDFNAQDKTYMDITDHDILAWTDSIGQLLNTILERDCTSLEVNGLTQMTHVYQDALRMFRPQSSPSLLSTLKSYFSPSDQERQTQTPPPNPPPYVLSGPTWKYERNRFGSTTKTQTPILAHLSPAAQIKSHLTHFTIGSKSLLCPPLLQWTCSVLASSPISTLTIRDVNFFGATWSILTILLPQSIPSLKRLELSNIGSFSHDQITRLMDSFPDLEYLSAERLELPWYTGLTSHTMQSIAFPTFRHLVELRVPEHWILPCFEFTPESLPVLKVLTIVFYDGEGWRRLEDQHSPVRKLFIDLSGRGQGLGVTVNMDILANTDIIRWMQMQRYQRSRLEEDEAERWIHCVSGLYLMFKGRVQFAHVLNAKPIVEAWFGQFPGLKRVSLRSQDKEAATVKSMEEFCRYTMPSVVKRLDCLEVNGKKLTIEVSEE
ncbi:hypothetical protein DFP72DRAFT_916615 [Ephemerocybe angulata]|uniref:Uncharacterized protein n=1 Tax=Ephemerocybe angulata TaxID=980116 RepID=A0A8H6HL58_9AGAR|nr:hypothetical protein DFP72DRAFT_916615 [Tulosesus angulatus]